MPLRSEQTQIAPIEEAPRLDPYREGDERQILDLFEKVFGARRTEEFWNWRFRRNPYDVPRVIVARDHSPTPRIVAQYAVIPVCFSVLGRKMKAAQSVDTMVDPEFRRHGLFESSARECFESLKKDEYRFVYGFPNHNSYPGFVRKLGWHRITFMNRFSMRLSITSALKKILHLPVLPQVGTFLFRVFLRARTALQLSVQASRFPGREFKQSNVVPENYDELWDSVRSLEVLSVWKDSKYFEWRYDQNPNHEFSYRYIVSEGRIEALAVVTNNHGSVEILELVVRDRRIEAARFLVDRIISDSLGVGAHELSFTGSSLDFFDAVFTGFTRAVSFTHVFCLGILSDAVPQLVATHPNNWTITQGDCDAY